MHFKSIMSARPITESETPFLCCRLSALTTLKMHDVDWEEALELPIGAAQLRELHLDDMSASVVTLQGICNTSSSLRELHLTKCDGWWWEEQIWSSPASTLR